MLRHINRKKIAMAAVLAAFALLSAGSILLARSAAAPKSKAGATNPNPNITTQNEYAVKFVCGVANTTETGREAVKPGNYATAINIHNPNQLPTTPAISFTKHVVLAAVEGASPIPPNSPVTENLASDNAMEVDCATIISLISPPPPPFIKGFLIILTASTNLLDVIGVYSAEPTPGQTGIGGIGLEILPYVARSVSK